MDIGTLPEWLQEWLHAEVAAGRAASPEDVTLTGDTLQRAQAWLEDRIYEGLDVAPDDRIDGPKYMAELGAMIQMKE
jgi:hypothetical protein